MEELRDLNDLTLSREGTEREFFIDNLLVRIHLIIEMIWWTGLATWEFEFPFPGSLTSTFQGEGTSPMMLMAFVLKKLKPRPESGRGWLICSQFA